MNKTPVSQFKTSKILATGCLIVPEIVIFLTNFQTSPVHFNGNFNFTLTREQLHVAWLGLKSLQTNINFKPGSLSFYSYSVGPESKLLTPLHDAYFYLRALWLLNKLYYWPILTSWSYLMCTMRDYHHNKDNHTLSWNQFVKMAYLPISYCILYPS